MKQPIKKVAISISKWVGENFDKCLHFIVCMLLTMVFSLFVPMWVAGITVLIIGIGKEIYDYADYGKFDWKDLIADIIGIGVILLFYYFNL